jgi:DNA polymerase III epsilon subunit-like protein
MPLTLIFDVETTGLLPKKKGDEMPHIIQLAYILYDTDRERILEVFNEYIKVPEGVIISPLITDLTGITQEMSEAGVPVEEALMLFYKAYTDADLLVAHNIVFDLTVIQSIASTKWRQLAVALNEKTKPIYCTMDQGINRCRIERTNSRGVYLKQPKLVELYIHLFGGEPPKGLHNAFMDVLCCLRCFVKMTLDKTIPEEVFIRWMLL